MTRGRYTANWGDPVQSQARQLLTLNRGTLARAHPYCGSNVNGHVSTKDT